MSTERAMQPIMSAVTIEDGIVARTPLLLGLDGPAGGRRASFMNGIPLAVFAVATLAALLHMAPIWRAQLQTPPGWTFTGNITVSPDYMQYRVWERQTQITGPIVADAFTSEPNTPYLLVPLYYAVGQVALWTGTPPEFVYDYAGAGLAFAFTVFLFVTVRHFLNGSPRQTWCIFLAILIGGGLGGHLKLLSNVPLFSDLAPVKATLVAATRAWPLWEDYRSHYVFMTLFDTHFLLVWLLTTAAVASLYFALVRPSFARLAVMAALYATTTLLHVYEGVTLLAITAAVAFLCWRKHIVLRAVAVTLATTTLVVGACLVVIMHLYVSSGLPAPTWRAVNILFATVLISYPLCWPIIAWGLSDYWRTAGLKECFLLGWALGCTALTLSGPFYPYPDRGTMTLQIPLFIIAATIYFSRRAPLSRYAIAVAVLVLAASPAFLLARTWTDTAFNSSYPFMFVSSAHAAINQTLDDRASPSDVLLEEQSDALWLAPEYPGKHYSAHFFLTVDYERKESEIAHFFQTPAADESTFLERAHIRFVYVDSARQPERFAVIPGLTLLKANQVGSLFEFMPATPDASR